MLKRYIVRFDTVAEEVGCLIKEIANNGEIIFTTKLLNCLGVEMHESKLEVVRAIKGVISVREEETGSFTQRG